MRHLRYFVAVAEARSFTRASEKLYVAQPAISRQIRDLEQEIGVALFLRYTRRVTLTPAGHAFLDDARRLLSDAEHAAERARRVARGEAGILSLAFLDAPTRHFLPPLLHAYHTRFPGIHIVLHEMPPERQLDAFAQGQISVGFTRSLPPGIAGMTSELVLDELLVAVVPRQHPLTTQNPLTVGALAGEPLILPDHADASGLHERVLSLCHEHGFSPQVILTAANLTTALLRVAASQGVSIVPQSAQNLRDDLCFLPLVPPPAPLPLVLAWRTDAETPPARAFRDLVRAERDAIQATFAKQWEPDTP